MNKLNKIKTVSFALIICLLLSLCGCGNSDQAKVIIDYGDAESFEAALNEGKNLEGKVVRFVAGEFHPDSELGYNIWAGEHLNFVSSRNPDIQENDTITVRVTTIENLFFRYSFESDISNASVQANAKAKEDSFMIGERNAVEMVQYNQSGTDLYITLKQVTDEIGSFSKFKLLFYKEDQIVGTEDGYFSIYAENLNGKDSTDVAKIWVYGVDYDRVEYVFEP